MTYNTLMKKTLATLALALALPAAATPQWPGYYPGGNCAGPIGSGCKYTLEIRDMGESMIQVPGLEYLGPSRASTIEHCEDQTGLYPYELLTDEEFDLFESCLIEHT